MLTHPIVRTTSKDLVGLYALAKSSAQLPAHHSEASE